MRGLAWVLCLSLGWPVYGDDIIQAETERARATDTLAQLKKEAQLSQKKLAVIEREITQINKSTTDLSEKIRNAEKALAALQVEQQLTNEALQTQQQRVEHALDTYANELKAYYITGRTLRPDVAPKSSSADYLPFLLHARQKTALELAQEQAELNRLLATQTQQAAAAQKQLDDLMLQRAALTRQLADQRQLLTSISREVSTSRSRQAALNADLEALDRRIQSLKLNQQDADIESLRGRLNWPVNGRVIRRFGQNRDDGFGTWQGLVISAPNNAEVRAVQAGKVAYAGYLLGYGLVVVIAHNNGHATIYGHNARLLVATGDAVTGQQVIAIAGNTGSLELSGVYFSVTKNGQAINPGPWLN